MLIKPLCSPIIDEVNKKSMKVEIKGGVTPQKHLAAELLLVMDA